MPTSPRSRLCTRETARHAAPSCLTRRRLLGCAAGAAALPLLAGCDELPFDLVSDETAARMGLEAWQQITAQTPRSEDPALQSALDRVAGRLLSAAGEDPGAWEAVAFGSPEVNAFALPGRRIGVFEGMFRVAGSEAQLAAVVGHEIGHVQAEHGQERITAQLTKEFGLRLVALLLQLGDVEFAREIAAALGLGVQYGLVLPYSRGQELEADRLGLLTMAAAGYEPGAAVELWRRMEAAGGQRLPEFLATHPAPQSRIEAIRAMLPEVREG